MIKKKEAVNCFSYPNKRKAMNHNKKGCKLFKTVLIKENFLCVSTYKPH